MNHAVRPRGLCERDERQHAEAAGLIGSAILTVSATITNVARVSAVDQSDLNSSNDSATATLTVTVAN